MLVPRCRIRLIRASSVAAVVEDQRVVAMPGARRRRSRRTPPVARALPPRPGLRAGCRPGAGVRVRTAGLDHRVRPSRALAVALSPTQGGQRQRQQRRGQRAPCRHQPASRGRPRVRAARSAAVAHRDLPGIEAVVAAAHAAGDDQSPVVGGTRTRPAAARSRTTAAGARADFQHAVQRTAAAQQRDRIRIGDEADVGIARRAWKTRRRLEVPV